MELELSKFRIRANEIEQGKPQSEYESEEVEEWRRREYTRQDTI